MNITQSDSQPIIISVGGSLVVPGQIDTDFLVSFKEAIIQEINKGKRFVIICGGGATARSYQDGARRVSNLSRDDLDWLGIHSTRLNAHLLRTIFKEVAHPKIITDPNEPIDFTESILVAAGFRPGCSTDYIAAVLAQKMSIKKLVNLTNVDAVFDKDPRKFDDASPIDKITWSEFRKIIPTVWDPGLHCPFDPEAARLADESRMKVAIVNGNKFDEILAFIDDKPFMGTLIY